MHTAQGLDGGGREIRTKNKRKMKMEGLMEAKELNPDILVT